MDGIYLDHNSTTPLLAEVAQAMAPWLGPQFGNPASQHQWGRRARRRLETARDAIGRRLGATADDDRITLTSGGTEANHLAVLGMSGGLLPGAPAGEAIISAIEHPSLAGPAELLQRRGWTIHRVPVNQTGVVDLESFDRLLTERTRWVSVMLASNETGVIQPVAELARRCAALGVPLHTDAAQAVGKIPVDFHALGASAMTIAPHKFHGPLGTGALITRRSLHLEPLFQGGFQQEGLRPGTESVALAVGFEAALNAWHADAVARTSRLRQLRDRFEAGLSRAVDGPLAINGQAAERLPQTSNVAFLGYDRQALLMALDLAGVACSAGSACASGSTEPSPVLKAMGCSDAALRGSLRFSLGATTTVEQVDEAVRRIAGVCQQVRGNRAGTSASAG